MNIIRPSLPSDGKLMKNVEISTLCAFYGGLLTAKQREALTLHYDEDLSLAEIAEQFCVSRQNIHDLISRSAQKLQRYEQAVGGVAQAHKAGVWLRLAAQHLQLAVSHLPTGEHSQKSAAEITAALTLVSRTITEIDGEEDTPHGI